ncbi:hypothetical protein LEP1GSC077_0020 [Leptospira interrogans str. C10069]|uniref:Uncharacterized protein n=1 Tax=Leptospira interrogans str. UI 12621 TaxID=1049937 RepID=A0A0F6H3A6_LEPIR|nr:hypothetical protein LEP1GSC077_0020 [Leptospira interrogans str. C10069]EKO22667.1 hypothetical protein LEP1GSC104_0033 [Leptospira interrogans str. UI 12621]EMN61445.1 hypothetical protein LEP1GSC092_0605 [Leptospira interrogans serovar Pyrogenes str. R168]EMN79730.1 hypothetical protein LEP1GSC106_0571 [Leptospira interrogans serovar Grippotyphosa str. UI 12764]
MFFYLGKIWPHPDFNRNLMKKSKLLLNISHDWKAHYVSTIFPDLMSEYFL